MARPRKVKPEESLTQLEGASKPEGTHLARRAKAALRALDDSRRLDADETRERMKFSEEQMRVLDCVAAGIPVRAAREAISALRLKADFLLSRPAAAVDHRIGIAVVNPYAEEKPALSVAVGAVAAPPEGQAPAAEDEAPPFEDESEDA